MEGITFILSHGKTNSCCILTAYFETENFTVKKQRTYHVSINDSKYILINLYNVNTDKEQIDVLRDLFALLKKFDIGSNKHLIMTGDFNLFFNSKLNAACGNPTLKRKYFAKLI